MKRLNEDRNLDNERIEINNMYMEGNFNPEVCTFEANSKGKNKYTEFTFEFDIRNFEIDDDIISIYGVNHRLIFNMNDCQYIQNSSKAYYFVFDEYEIILSSF